MTTTPLETAPQAQLYSALALTTASQIAATSSVLALAAVPTLVAATLGVSPHLVGYQISLIYASGVVFSMLAGGMVKRWGAGRIGQMALILAGIGCFGLASGTLWGIALSSALIGVGYAVNNPASSHVLARLVPAAKRNLMFSVKQAGVPIGGVVAAQAIAPLAHALGWQAAVMLFALVPLGLAVIYQIFCRTWDDDRDPQAPVLRAVWSGQRLVWADPDLRALSIIGFLFSAMQLCISAFIVAMLIEQFGWSPLHAASAAAGVQAAGAFGRVFWGALADKVGSGFQVLGIVGLLTALATLGFGLIEDMPMVGLVAAIGAGITGLGWNGVLLAETAKASPAKGTLTGEVLTYIFLGVMVGPAAFSAAYGLMGDYTSTFRLFAVLVIAGSVLALMRGRRIPAA